MADKGAGATIRAVRDPLAFAERPRGRRAAAAALVGLLGLLLVLGSLHKPLAFDEYDNLSYGYRFLAKGPNVQMLGQRMPALAVSALGCAASGCDLEPVQRSEARRLLVRAGSMLFAIGLVLVAYAWARDLAGPAAGLAALCISVLDPTVLAHGKQVTSDVAVAFFTAAAVYAWWRHDRRPTTWTLLACAGATAGAILSKFTGLLLLPILAVFVLARAAAAGRLRDGREVGRLLGRAVLFAAVALLLVNAAYRFDGTFRTLRDYHWRSAAFDTRLPRWPVPLLLPRAFVQGLDYSSVLQENPTLGRGSNYVLGELNRDGRWYAFPLMLLLKTPLAVFALAGLSLARRPRGADLLALLVPPVVVVGCFSLLVAPQLGIRYVLPALPFLHVLAGRAAGVREGRRGAAIVLLLAWQAGSVLSYHPQYMSYFNELIGPRVNAYRFLADSNLDWEDRSWFVDRFVRRHPEMAITVDPDGPRGGYVLVGATELVGVFDPERYRWLREGFRPLRAVEYSHLLYYVPPERLRDIVAQPPRPRSESTRPKATGAVAQATRTW